MNVPIINGGQRQPLLQPQTGINVSAGPGGVILEIVRNGGEDVHRAGMPPEVAVQVMHMIGAALESINPGSLALILANWQWEIEKRMRLDLDNLDEVLRGGRLP